MALRFIDSFDHYATAQIGKKWSALVNSPTVSTGRFGSGLNSSNWNTGVYLTLDSQATWYVGFAFYYTALYSAAQPIGFRDGTTLKMDLRLNSSGNLYFTRNGTTVGSTSTQVLTTDVWHYVEVGVTINDGAGIAKLYVDGVQWLNGTGLDTWDSGNVSADRIYFLSNSTSTSATLRIDDVYICDGTGSSPTNTFLGDVRVEAIFPSDNGNSSQWVGSDADSTDNFQLVDEATPATGDYVESSTVGNKDTYTMGNLATVSGTVFGVQPIPYAAKTDAGSRAIVSVARLSGTEVDSANKSLSTTETYYPDIRETKPGGGSWSVSDVNSAEFGVKVAV